MAEVFIGLVKKMVIFLVAGQTILHFGMGKQYERYVKLIISLMMVAQLLSAGFGLFSHGKDRMLLTKEKKLISSFEEGWKVNMEEFEKHLYEKQEEFEDRWKSQDLQPKETGEAGNFQDSGTQYGRIRIEEIRIQ